MKNLVIESLKAMACKKCGASNNAKGSKHAAFTAKGFHWCGHCGGKLVAARHAASVLRRDVKRHGEAVINFDAPA